MNRSALLLAGVLGFLGVTAGTFGAHGLESILPAAVAADPAALAERQEWMETGVRYHLVHALAILGVAALPIGASKPARIAVALFALGIFLFSGALYGLALTGMRWLGMVAPLGGLSLMAGWVCLIPAARNKSAA